MKDASGAGRVKAAERGPFDIGERLEQGFRMIIVPDPEMMTVGRAAAGRNQGVGVCLWERLEELLYAADCQG